MQLICTFDVLTAMICADKLRSLIYTVSCTKTCFLFPL